MSEYKYKQAELFGVGARGHLEPSRGAQLAEGERRKDAGIDQAVASKGSLVEHARAVAVELGRSADGGLVSMDDVHAALEAQGISQHALGKSAGGVFRGNKQWKAIGTRKSTRPGRHACPITVWKFRAEGWD